MSMTTGLGGVLVVWTVGLLMAGLSEPPRQANPPSALPLHLTGLMVDKETPSKSACLILCTGPVERRGMFFAGQNVCDLAAIQEIRDDGVIITNLLTKRVEVLTFSPAKPSTGALPPPPAVPAPAAASDIVAIELPKASVDLYLANLPDLLASAVAVPRYRETANGRRSIDGYEIGQVRQGGAVEQMGLRDGDVVLEVNGQPLDGMATVMRILGQIQNMPQAKVTVLRKGQRMTFVFNTK